MKTLATFRADHNNFSGKIPIELGHCCSLNELNLGNNAFQGVIPTSFSFLSSLEKLDLSHNNLSGPIPAYIKNFKYLKFLDLSSNNFKGEVPNGGIFLNSSAISLSGNHRICGGPSNLHLLSCPKKEIGKIRRSSHLRVVISIICSSIVVLLMASIVVVYCKRKPSKVRSSLKDPLEGKYWRVSYQDLLKATNGFSTDCLIGSGRYGSVFKATFEEGITIAAVKVFNLQIQGSSRTFAIECKALRRIRHGNLVKILTSCASVDHRGNEFKAIVFEYMTNGSLHEWLQDNEGSNQISKMQRLRIAIDVATALDYLHNQCEKPIVHCDLKSQILNDSSSSFTQGKSSSSVNGTIGYVPPEYGIGGEASTYGDVYSYGILLLEMFTGKKPTDDMFTDALNLHTFVEVALPDKFLDILDGRLLQEDGTHNNSEATIKCIASMLHVGVLCSAPSPQERPLIKDVLKETCDIRDTFIHCSYF